MAAPVPRENTGMDKGVLLEFEPQPSPEPELEPEAEAAAADRAGADRVATVQKAMQLLEVIAARGGCTARQLSEVLGFPLPTVYRLAQELVASGFLVHLRSDHRFELGFKVYGLGASLHQQLAASSPVRAAIDHLHNTLGMAAYYAIYRGADVVVTYVSDCAEHPRLSPLRFGFHEAAHATAFGKIMLAAMSVEQRDHYLLAHGTPPLTAATVTDRERLDAILATVALRGIAWEKDEFVPAKTCAAVGIRDPSGLVVGAVAISMDSDTPPHRVARVEHALREHAQIVSRFYRSGGNQLALA